MISVQSFVCSPYQENTYVLYDGSGECVIIDPGMYNGAEQDAVASFIDRQGLRPVLLLNTHCHIDHVFGNKFVFDQYGLLPQFHRGELPLLTAVPSYALLLLVSHWLSLSISAVTNLVNRRLALVER